MSHVLFEAKVSDEDITGAMYSAVLAALGEKGRPCATQLLFTVVSRWLRAEYAMGLMNVVMMQAHSCKDLQFKVAKDVKSSRTQIWTWYDRGLKNCMPIFHGNTSQLSLEYENPGPKPTNNSRSDNRRYFLLRLAVRGHTRTP